MIRQSNFKFPQIIMLRDSKQKLRNVRLVLNGDKLDLEEVEYESDGKPLDDGSRCLICGDKDE